MAKSSVLKNFKSLFFVQKMVWVLKGFALGLACLVPGVSVGTMALILGVYEKLIVALTFFVAGPFKKKGGFCSFGAGLSLRALWDKGAADFIFLFCLTVGGGAAVWVGAGLISGLLKNFPLELYSVFTGLILASLPKIFNFTNKKKNSTYVVLAIAFSMWGGLWFFSEVFEWDVFIREGWEGFYYSGYVWFGGFLFASGFLGAFASVLPGLSGSMVLVVMGTYPVVLGLLTQISVWNGLLIAGAVGGVCAAFFILMLFNKKTFLCVLLLGVVGVLILRFLYSLGEMGVFLSGGGLGFVASLWCSRFLLDKKRNLLFCVALGLVIGSLPFLLPYRLWWTDATGFATLRMVVFVLLGVGGFSLMDNPRVFLKSSLKI